MLSCKWSWWMITSISSCWHDVSNDRDLINRHAEYETKKNNKREIYLFIIIGFFSLSYVR
jgi:hypothetical protein